MKRVREHYRQSNDHNGLPVRALEAYGGSVTLTIIELISQGEIDLVRGDIHPNPHIKALQAEPVDEQVKKINRLGLGSGCLYPTEGHLRRFANKSTNAAPFTSELDFGVPQLDFRIFDVRVLDWYRNDPRFSFRVNDIQGQINRKVDTKSPNSQIPFDDIEFFQFGFAYNEKMERAIAAFLRYLSDLPPEQQRHFAAFQLDGKFELHPDFYRTRILGQFPLGISIYDAFLMEKRAIGELCEMIGKPSLFRTVGTNGERPSGFGILLRSTRKEFEDFSQLLDKLLGDDINRDFFAGDIPLHEVLTREDGTTEKRSLPTIGLLERWLRENFQPQSPAQIVEMLKYFRDVRKKRNRPAHVIDENRFDTQFFVAQQELISKALRAVRMLRTILQNHPDTCDFQVPTQLDNSTIWVR